MQTFKAKTVRKTTEEWDKEREMVPRYTKVLTIDPHQKESNHGRCDLTPPSQKHTDKNMQKTRASLCTVGGNGNWLDWDRKQC